MVHYIRLLGCPQVSINNKGLPLVSAVTSVTTDLGDDFLWTEIQLRLRVVNVRALNETIAQSLVIWKPHARVAKLTIPCPKHSKGRPCKLHVAVDAVTLSTYRVAVPQVLDVWSAEFKLEHDSRPDLLVERRFNLNESLTLSIWEESGESIARHVWDAALACLVYLQDVFASPSEVEMPLPILAKMLRQKGKSSLSVLELGAGCGVVGIALASLFPKCDVLLTDLIEARSIIQMNIKQIRPAASSDVRWQLLDWAENIHVDALPAKLDLIIIADCIYNTNSIPFLINTISSLVAHSPSVKILVARKPRHDSEMLFFELIQDLPITLLEQSQSTLPHMQSSELLEAPNVEFHLYGCS